MKDTTVAKFDKWCKENGLSLNDEIRHSCGSDRSHPNLGYYPIKNEIMFIGECDEGEYFILKLLDFSEGKSDYSNNGIVIRKMFWDSLVHPAHWSWGKGSTSKIVQHLHTDLSNDGIKEVQNWIAKHTKYTKFPKFGIKDFVYLVKDFICKVDDSSKTLKVVTNHGTIEGFFESDFKFNDTLTIMAVDTKMPIITLEKVEKDGDEMFRFIVDITNQDGDDFRIRTTFDSQDKFKSLVSATINALKEFKAFYKYADELENCL